MRAAQWISRDKFVAVLDDPNDSFFEAVLWQITPKEDVYQITKIADRLFDKNGKISAIADGVLGLNKRVFISCLTDEKELISYFPPKTRNKVDLLLLDIQGADIEMKKVADSLRSLHYTYASHQDMIFALDYPGLSVYLLTEEGVAKCAWKKSGLHFLYESAANDQWYVATRSETIPNVVKG